MRLVYLADLSHTGQLVASNTFPMGIGLLAASIKQHLNLEVEIFKYPQDLNEALKQRIPDLIGFSNYSWSCNLGQEYARRIKEQYPRTVVIAGGPNYGLSEWEQLEYWGRFPYLDFYVLKEGELAIVKLLKALEMFFFNVDELKRNLQVPSCHYMLDGQLYRPELMERIKNLNDLPSPYLMGLMDKFFDGVLIPMTYTTRGCPFQCSFCQEGVEYYSKVAKRTTLEEDLDYIGQRVGTIQDLIITDANFGMFREDKDKAHAIARIQDKYNWPKHIHVSGGKNQKERLIEVATIINGAMNVAASLQSTDKSVLQNVRRSNISVDELKNVAKAGNNVDANTYAELILNLPGDSKQAHTQSLRDSVNAGLSFLRLYQLIMLPETDMNTPETRKQFGMQTKWRVMPRCFGQYEFFDEKFVSIEAEEICIAQDSMPFEDYLDCRELDLTIEITHNVNMFRELYGLCQQFNISWFDFLMRFHENRRTSLKSLYDTFREDTIKPLWETREELMAFAKSNLDRYLLDELGTNELFKAKAIAFFTLQQELHEALYGEMRLMLPDLSDYLDQAMRYSLHRKHELLDTQIEEVETFDYDFIELAKLGFEADPRDYMREITITFSHDEEQKKATQAYVKQYGTTTLGLGRILMRAHMKRLFRNASVGESSVKIEPMYRRALNLFAD